MYMVDYLLLWFLSYPWLLFLSLLFLREIEEGDCHGELDCFNRLLALTSVLVLLLIKWLSFSSLSLSLSLSFSVYIYVKPLLKFLLSTIYIFVGNLQVGAGSLDLLHAARWNAIWVMEGKWARYICEGCKRTTNTSSYFQPWSSRSYHKGCCSCLFQISFPYFGISQHSIKSDNIFLLV